MPDALIRGYRRFKDGYFKQHEEQLKQLARGQSPRIAMISCCDSRVDPGVVFDAEPGDLFVIRNVANLVPPNEPDGRYHGTSAALEFAVTGLEVSHVVVLGHAQCGGINSLLTRSHQYRSDSFIDDWMQIAEPVRLEIEACTELATPRQRQTACEQRAICLSLDNLMTFPWIRQRVTEGSLTLHGWYYDLETGSLQTWDQQADRWIEVEKAAQPS